MKCHLSDRIGHSRLESIDGNNFGQVKFSPINRVVPMRGFTIRAKVHEKLVIIDPRMNWKPAIFWSLFPGLIRKRRKSKRLVLCIEAGGVAVSNSGMRLLVLPLFMLSLMDESSVLFRNIKNLDFI
ncbi:hypothetical protein AVEN_60686-1 [Araneus ventricosus]|uniref:Uncharacterized protein n=1 Tax=Araneus ventricosus TaxID=182803 RepID=A0A4Y2MET6_ARAVE|nr:hypothetical protein AVEN_60686-1 [Araneus ventricosus]